MSATEPGQYTVIVQKPDSTIWRWDGYADNVSDALAHAENERQAAA